MTYSQLPLYHLDTTASTQTRAEVLQGDCLEVLRLHEDDSFESAVTDPPYGLSKEPDIAEVLTKWLAGEDYKHRGGGFMGKSWDSFVPGPSIWREVYRVLKPGAFMLVFAGTRTQDLMTISLRFAGFNVIDTIQWIYGSGFPKSHNVQKALEKLGEHEAAEHFAGYGSALKPSHEPIILVRKPLSESSIARNVLEHGCGGLNIDGCRVGSGEDRTNGGIRKAEHEGNETIYSSWGDQNQRPTGGRFPANLLLSHSPGCVRIGEKRVKGTNISYDRGNKQDARASQVIPTKEGVTGNHCDPDGKETVAAYECARDEAGNYICPIALMDEMSGVSKSKRANRGERDDIRSDNYGRSNGQRIEGSDSVRGHSDSGGSSRFFQQFHEPDTGAGFVYQSKASKRDRSSNGAVENTHPTAKPTALLQYLARLICPLGGTVLDPFLGSGSTAVACLRENFNCIGIEQDPEYASIARARIDAERNM